MDLLFVGILIGLIINKYISPILDVLCECFTYKISEFATKSQIVSQTMAKEFELKYPEPEESQELMPAIGFHNYDIQEKYIDENDCEDIGNKYHLVKENGNRVVGFKMQL